MLLLRNPLKTLVLDVGNTSTKAGCFADGLLRETIANLTPAAVPGLVQRWQPQHVLVASVAAPAAEWATGLQALVPGRVLAFVPGTTPVPLTNAYATPATLGADRLAAVVGAAGLWPGQAVLVIDAGTALKLDLAAADGTYHGGSIAPGLAMRLRALHEFTGRLPLLPLPAPDATVALVGDSTQGSMLSGVVNGTVAELNGLLAQYRAHYQGLVVMLTGGDAAFLAPRLAGRIFVVPELVLLGLYRILAYNVEA